MDVLQNTAIKYAQKLVEEGSSFGDALDQAKQMYKNMVDSRNVKINVIKINEPGIDHVQKVCTWEDYWTARIARRNERAKDIEILDQPSLRHEEDNYA